MPASSGASSNPVRLSRRTTLLVSLLVLAAGPAYGQSRGPELEVLTVPTGVTIGCDSTAQDQGRAHVHRRRFKVNGDLVDERNVEIGFDSSWAPRVLIDVVAKVVDDHPTLTVLTVYFSADSVTGARLWHRTVAPLSSMRPDSMGAFTEMKFPLSAAERDAARKLATWLGSQRCTGQATKSKAPATIL